MKPRGRFSETHAGNVTVLTLSALADNYQYVILSAGRAAAVDPAEAGPVLDAVRERGAELALVLNTHRHQDHTAGNAELQQAAGCEVVGAAGPRVQEGMRFEVGRAAFEVLLTPGHTRSHVCFYAAPHGLLFTGDTLFVGGCGRILEASAADLWASLEKLARLPDNTMVFCGHEYTAESLRFALEIEPGREVCRRRLARAEANDRAGRPNVPSTIGLEKATNPFLRAGTDEMAAAMGMTGRPTVDVFTELRRRKDAFG